MRPTLAAPTNGGSRLASRNQSERTRGRSQTTIKGKLVEQIVAAMHDAHGATVSRNVKLPSIGSSRKREIDVLIEANVSGYPVRIAVECKNLDVKVDPERIDAFVGKLQAVGIPVQHGIYVAVKGYTPGALDRAVAAGIRPLVLTGLTSERIAAAVSEAYQSIIYLLPSVESLTVSNDVASVVESAELLAFYDDSGFICATVPDMLWEMWRDGRIPRDIGKHDIEVPLDPSWHSIINGAKSRPLSIHATVHVRGLVITIRGQSSLHQLVNASDSQVEKTQLAAQFTPDEPELPVLAVESEAELEAAIEHGDALSVSVGRFPLPRIVLFRMYWPPSERLAATLEQAYSAYARGEGPNPASLTLAEIEGTSLNSVWDPIWQGHRLYRGEQDVGG